MAIIKQEFKGLECDGCKKQFRETEDNGWFYEQDDLIEAATSDNYDSEEWYVGEEGHYCDICRQNKGL